MTHDLGKTYLFYNGIMEFPVIRKEYNCISFKAGDSILHFHEAILPKAPVYHVAFSLPNNVLQKALHWVSQRQSILPYSPGCLVADFKGWNAEAFYFHDNQQNILEFITHYDLQSFYNGEFDSSAIERICEIGIVVNDVRVACEDLRSKYQLPYFIKGPLLEDFAAMGDTRGLLIISRENRNWLPTLQPAKKFPIKLLAEINSVNITIDA